MTISRERSSNQLTSGTAVLLMVVIAGSHLAKCQFLQPQSHLGRLVQSIASPLVLSSSLSGASDSSDSYDPESGSHSRPDKHQHQHQNQYQQEAGQNYQHYQLQPDYNRQHHNVRGGQQQQRQRNEAVVLQQAPSQQRGIPQRYYDGSNDDEDSQAHTNHRQQPSANEQYQMGTYLGPTVDDKEIQGAFNSNDDRDDDDAPGYDGPPGGGRQRDGSAFAASQPEGAGGYHPMEPSGGDQSGYGPSTGSYGGPSGGQYAGADGGAPSSRGHGERGNFDDDSGVDEDDEPAPRGQPRFRSGMSQAASQYHQRQNRHPSQYQQGNSPMMAAANGYSPMGSGPFDLNSLMAAAGGGGNGQAYEVYNGDGSYPGYYPQQQQQQQQGRHNQAASMNNPYGYGQNGQQMGGHNGDQNGATGNRQRDGDNDDADSEVDED